MKCRFDYVTNSSSSSFIISKDKLSENQIEAIPEHSELWKFKNLKKWKRRNLAVNIGFCLGSYFLFGFNPIALGLSYIASDVLLSVIDLGIRKKYTNDLFKSNDPEIIKKIIAEEKKELDNLCYLGKFNFDEFRNYNEFLEKAYNSYKKQLEELKLKKEKEEHDLRIATYRGLHETEEIIISFLNFYENLIQEVPESRLKGLKKIKKEFLIMKDKLEKKPEASYLVKPNIGTYTHELMDIVKDYINIPIGNKETYEERYYIMLSEFLTYLKDINTTIDNSTMANTELGIETLISALKEHKNTESDS